ncbi:MAG: alpha-ribazole phosphatase [Syntrophomonadaceae bacterium]|nr:alpha-ribazole phosphatase [Syntrophomonadaceae bacterium]
MLRIFLIRHGETKWNKDYRYQGHTDIPLNEIGEKQSRLVAQRLKKEALDAVYSSDLSRALATAQYIAQEHKLCITVLPALREINYGQWEGLTLDEINKKYPGLRDQWLKDPKHCQVPEGESLAKVQQRALSALGEIQRRHQEGTVAVVTHGGVIVMLLLHFLKEDTGFLRKFFSRNTSVTLVEIDNSKIDVVFWGDASHLDEI